MINYFCGIDTSKDSFSVAISSHSSSFFSSSFPMSLQGFLSFEKIISPLKDSLLIGMESTGIYHLNLLSFLKEKAYNVSVIHPVRLKNFFRFLNPKPSKSDSKDAKIICKFLMVSTENNTPPPPIVEMIKPLVREAERVSQSIAKTKTEIKTLLSILFPELEAKFPIFAKNILSILLDLPSAQTIRSIPKELFSQIISNQKGKGRRVKGVERIFDIAQSSIAGTFPFTEELIRIKIKRLLYFEEERGKVKEVIESVAERVFEREIRILTSIPGIGKSSAISFMTEIGGAERFSSKGKLIGFCGLDPTVKQSGKYKGQYKISKKGSSHARRIVWIMADSVRKYSSYFREYYQRKREQGRTHKEAVTATATKLLRVIFALLSENRLFEERISNHNSI